MPQEKFLAVPFSVRLDPLTNAYQLSDAIAASAADNVLTTGTAPIISYNPITGSRNVIGGVMWSYSAAPTNPRLTIENGSGVYVLNQVITAAGAMDFFRGLAGDFTKELIIRITAPATGTFGALYVKGHWAE